MYDQHLLIQFLKTASLCVFIIDKEFNLGQNFFNEISEFLTLDSLVCYDKTFSGLSEFSFLTKLNFNHFNFYHDRIKPREAILSIIKKPSCRLFQFEHSSSSYYKNREKYNRAHEVDAEDENYDGDYDGTHFRCETISKKDGYFWCERCGWTSEKDLNFSDAIVESVICHVDTFKKYGEYVNPGRNPHELPIHIPQNASSASNPVRRIAIRFVKKLRKFFRI